jgi:hypothetical protein
LGDAGWENRKGKSDARIRIAAVCYVRQLLMAGRLPKSNRSGAGFRLPAPFCFWSPERHIPEVPDSAKTTGQERIRGMDPVVESILPLSIVCVDRLIDRVAAICSSVEEPRSVIPSGVALFPKVEDYSAGLQRAKIG